MPEGKIVYQEKCIIEAKSKEGKIYKREVSLAAKELSRKQIEGKRVIEVDVEFKNGLNIEKDTLVISDLKFVRDYFLKKISAAIDLVSPERIIRIIFPEGNKYLKMRRAYCQNCGKFIREFYGFYEGRIEKCPSCNRLTVLKRNTRKG